MGYTIIFSDSDTPTKEVTLKDPKDFLKVVQAEGQDYTNARCDADGKHLYAYRHLGELNWVCGTFAEIIRDECRRAGFELYTFNTRDIRSWIENDGVPMADVVRSLRAMIRSSV